jgi:translation initiation factor IF-3
MITLAPVYSDANPKRRIGPIKELRINERIRVREVRLVRDDGEQAITATVDALSEARERNLDLVEVAPNSNPPVCKIMDYGKYRFETEKKTGNPRKNRNRPSSKK